MGLTDWTIGSFSLCMINGKVSVNFDMFFDDVTARTKYHTFKINYGSDAWKLQRKNVQNY